MSKIVVHDTDMKIPIFNTLYMNTKKEIKSKNLDIKILNNLSLSKVDPKKFTIKKIIKKIPNKHSLFETVLVSTNDTIVKNFLDGKIHFLIFQELFRL